MKKKNIYFKKIINEPILESDKFFQKIKIKRLVPTDETQLYRKEWSTVLFKGYPRFETLELPHPKLPNNISLKQTFLKRKSSRTFSKSKLSLKKLSTLLYYSAGLRDNKSPHIANRFYPSGGSRYPLEIYILSFNTELPKGIYHYYLKSHCLERLFSLNKFGFKKYFNQNFISQASCVIVITAVFKRTQIKYGNRGFNYVMLEAGHLGQNIYLNCAALNIACCAVGGYNDYNIDKLLDIDGFLESVIYLLALG